MKVYFANLNPCNTRKVNVRQYQDFVVQNSHELVDNKDEADVIFIWGCEFRADWRDFSYNVAKELKEKTKVKIVYIGCVFEEGYVSKIKKDLDIEVIPWKDGRNLFEKIISDGDEKVNNTTLKLAENKLVDDAVEYRQKNPSANVSFEDEYIKLSVCEGCLNNCSYCSERQMFPGFKSFDEEELINQCVQVVQESQTKKVYFLGDNTGDYGRDTATSLSKLIMRLKKRIGSDLQIGISQLNPDGVFKDWEEMIKLIVDGTIVYINIPIQSASDKMLNAMKRSYNLEKLEKLFSEFKKVGFENFSTHLLVGFPGETIKDLEASIEFLLKYPPKHVVVSAFMSHPSIEASSYENQVGREESKRRIQMCEEKLSGKGIKVATDWGKITQKIMDRIMNSIF